MTDRRTDPTTLLVWRQASPRLEDDLRIRDLFSWGPAVRDCSFCAIPLVGGREAFDGGDTDWFKCPLCGWDASMTTGYALGLSATWCRVAIATEYDINAPELAMQELAAHLQRRYSDIFAVSWDRFERLIEDVFKRHGYRVRHTKLSWDNGADLLVLGTDGNEVAAIVECKKYSEGRTVGVGIVRSVVGAAVYWATDQAIIVTDTQFTDAARAAAVHYATKGFTVDLIGATELLTLFNAYNVALPPLQDLTDSARKALVDTNSLKIRDSGIRCLSTNVK